MLVAFFAGLGAVVAAMTLLWMWSVRLEDASIVDGFWGPGFLLVSLVYRGFGPAPEPRQLLLLALVALWAVRLAIYIIRRNHGQGEDRRYTAMRRGYGERFRTISLVRVFLFQGVLISILSLPFLFVQAQPVSSGLLLTDYIGLGLWILGFFFEVVGDAQIARFKADPANKGKVMDRGLWRYTRHPNYFGEATLWWGYFIIALGAPGGWWTLPCPIIMTFFLLKVSGVALLEKTIVDRRPAYRRYIETTSAFIPLPPRRQEHAER